uniref:Uncharacterized protein n=1 Tax=Fagus sylvatica TaxID=28930 RepID=A0A2N9FSZ4_FAGSY
MVVKIARKRSKTNHSTLNLPPGPWKLPIIGNMHQFVGSLPHRALRDMAKKHGPLMHLRLGEVTTIVVSTPELAKEEAIKVAAGFNIVDVFPSVKLLHLIRGVRTKLEKMHQEVDKIMGNIINEHKEQKATTKADDEDERAEDLIDVLLKFHQENGSDNEFSLTTNNIKAVIMDIFGAGSETSATTVEWAMECRERCILNGYEIPVKTKVIINAWAIGRDPKYWTEAEKFYPERFLDSSIDYKGTKFEFIPFGAGRRICPGITFGPVNVELPLALFLYHFDWKLSNGMKNEDLDMTEAFGITV